MFYVYLHKKLNGEVFYVGKGKGSRAYSSYNRNRHWKSVVAKYGLVVEIVLDGLQEWYAFELEKDLIAYYGLNSEGGTLTNVTYGGGGNGGYKFNEKDKESISKGTSGNKNGRSDKNTYQFLRLIDQEIFIGTRQDFIEKYNINISDLFKSKVMTVYGWTLYENKDKISKCKFDATVYNFINSQGIVVRATRREFKKITGIDSKPLFRKKPAKVVNGWSLI